MATEKNRRDRRENMKRVLLKNGPKNGLMHKLL
jgi:hypothetical protein